MSNELQCQILAFQSRLLTLRYLIQAEQVKEYDADWLDSGVTINRDKSGKFAKKIPVAKLGEDVSQSVQSVIATLKSIQTTSDLTLEILSNFIVDPKFRERAGLVAGMNLANSIKSLAQYANVNPEFVTEFDKLNERCLKRLAQQYGDTELAQFLKPDPVPSNISFQQRLELQAAKFQACKDFFELPRTPEETDKLGKKAENLANLLKAGVGIITTAALTIAPEMLFGMFFAGGVVPGVNYLLTSFALTSAASYVTDKTLDLFLKKDSTLRFIIQTVVDLGSAITLSKVSLDLINNLPKIKSDLLGLWSSLKSLNKAVAIIRYHEFTDTRVKNLPKQSKDIVVNSLRYVFDREKLYRDKLIEMGIEESLIDDAIANSKKLIDNSRMMIRVRDEDVASQILDDRFKSTFETNARANPLYVNWRKKIEDATLGVKEVMPFNKKFPDDERPIYGFLVDGSDPIGGSYKKEGDYMNGYGSISMLIDNSVKKTSFFTASDSFRRPGSSPMETSGILAFLPADANSLYDFDLTNKGQIKKILNAVKNSKTIDDLRRVGAMGVKDNKVRYLEFQSFGKITNKEVSNIVVHTNALESKNIGLSIEIFGEEINQGIAKLIKKARKKGIGVFYEQDPDSPFGYVATLKEAAKYDKYLDIFKEGSSLYSHPIFGFNFMNYNSITRLFPKHIQLRDSSAIDFRHNLLREISSSLNNNPIFSKTTDYDLSLHKDWVNRRSMFKEGLTRYITQEGWDEYRQATKTMIEKIKTYDPNFFYDFERYTGREIDFGLESSYIPFQ